MLYKYGQIECAGWFAGKQNVLTGTTYIKISREWRRCDLPILLDDGAYYIKWGWLFTMLVFLCGSLHLDWAQTAALILECLTLKEILK